MFEESTVSALWRYIEKDDDSIYILYGLSWPQWNSAVPDTVHHHDDDDDDESDPRSVSKTLIGYSHPDARGIKFRLLLALGHILLRAYRRITYIYIVLDVLSNNRAFVRERIYVYVYAKGQLKGRLVPLVAGVRLLSPGP